MMPSHTYEIERIKWLLANGHPNYALWRTIKLIVRLKKELVVLRYSQAIVYADLYRHHVMFELSVRQQLPIIRDFVTRRFRRASPLTRPEHGEGQSSRDIQAKKARSFGARCGALKIAKAMTWFMRRDASCKNTKRRF